RGQEHSRPLRVRRRRRRDLARDDHGHERQPRDPQQLAPRRSRVPHAARAAVSLPAPLAGLRAAALRILAAFTVLATGALYAQEAGEDDGGWNFDDLDEAEPTLFELFQNQALEIGIF